MSAIRTEEINMSHNIQLINGQWTAGNIFKKPS